MAFSPILHEVDYWVLNTFFIVGAPATAFLGSLLAGYKYKRVGLGVRAGFVSVMLIYPSCFVALLLVAFLVPFSRHNTPDIVFWLPLSIPFIGVGLTYAYFSYLWVRWRASRDEEKHGS